MHPHWQRKFRSSQPAARGHRWMRLQRAMRWPRQLGCRRWAGTSAHGFVIDRQTRTSAARAANIGINGLSWVQPACGCVCIQVSGGEDNKVAGLVIVAVVPARSPAFDSNSKFRPRSWIIVGVCDEQRSTTRRSEGNGGGNSGCSGSLCDGCSLSKHVKRRTWPKEE
jgi:hypothetical protein